jgi:hypothetical protein
MAGENENANQINEIAMEITNDISGRRDFKKTGLAGEMGASLGEKFMHERAFDDGDGNGNTNLIELINNKIEKWRKKRKNAIGNRKRHLWEEERRSKKLRGKKKKKGKEEKRWKIENGKEVWGRV